MKKKNKAKLEEPIAVKIENPKKETLEDETPTLDEIEKEIVQDLKKTKKKSFLWLKLLLVGIIIIIVSILFTVMPQLEIIGPSIIELKYNEKYEEQGAIANYLGKNITKRITISGNVDITKVGKYKVKYTVKYGMFTVFKTRVVEVYDDKKPVLTLIGDKEVTICPNSTYKEEGFYLFMEPIECPVTIRIEANGYFPGAVSVDSKKLNPSYPVVDVRLYHKPGGQFPYRCSISGKSPSACSQL